MIGPYGDLTVDVLADWVEVSSLLAPSGIVSQGAVSTALDGRSVANPDERTAQVWMLVANRAELLGGRYPFTVTNQTVAKLDPSPENLAYRFMVLLSCDGHYPGRCLSKAKINKVAKGFELLTVHALAGYLGAETLNVGAPRRGDLRIPLRDCVGRICILSHEPRGNLTPSTSKKDDGADIVAWIPHGDARGGQVFVIAQCTIQADLAPKSAQLSLGKWHRYVDTLIPALTAYAVPWDFVQGGVLGSDPWDELTSDLGGMLLDRTRLTLGFGRRPPADGLVTELGEYVGLLSEALPH